MSNPIAAVSIEDETSEATGRDIETLAHDTYSVFAIADGESVTNNVEIVLEGSPDREHWAPIDTRNEEDVLIEHNDFDECPDTGKQTAYIGGAVASHYIRYIRARIREPPDDADMTVWVMANGNTDGRGVRPTERLGPAAEL